MLEPKVAEGIVLKKIEGRGRGLVTARNIARGEIIIIEDPFAMTPSAEFYEACCAECAQLVVGGTALALEAADSSRFCSIECISSCYNQRILEMRLRQEIAVLGVQGSQDPLHLLARIATNSTIKQTSHSITGIPLLGSTNNFSHLLSLEASDNNAETTEAVRQLSTLLSTKFALYGVTMTAKHIHHLLLAIQCNAHRIVDSHTGYSLALGLFPYTSMMNHSCAPNCEHHFVFSQHVSPRLVMRTLQEIPADTECTYSYTQLYQSLRDRRDSLRGAYGFECNCHRCSVIDDAWISAESEGSDACKRELEICLKLLHKDASMRMKLLPKLEALLTSKIRPLHPQHQMIFQAHTSIATASYEAYTDSTTKDMHHLKLVIAYGLLSLATSLSVLQKLMADNLQVLIAVTFALQPYCQQAEAAARMGLGELVHVLLREISYCYETESTAAIEELVTYAALESPPMRELPLNVQFARFTKRELEYYNYSGARAAASRYAKELEVIATLCDE